MLLLYLSEASLEEVNASVVDGFTNNWGVTVNKSPGLLNRISSEKVRTFMG